MPDIAAERRRIASAERRCALQEIGACLSRGKRRHGVPPSGGGALRKRSAPEGVLTRSQTPDVGLSNLVLPHHFGYSFDVSTIQDIEAAVSKLSREELAAFRQWFQNFDAEAWDKQLGQDIAAGRL